MTLDAFLGHFHNVSRSKPDRWTAECPGHDDASQHTLQITIGRDERRLLRCWAGCDARRICQAAGLDLTDLFRDGRTPRGHRAPDPPYSELYRTTVRDELTRRARLYGHYQSCSVESDLIRLEHHTVAALQQLATSGDADTDATWDLLALASKIERSALAAEAAQDAEFTRLREARHAG